MLRHLALVGLLLAAAGCSALAEDDDEVQVAAAFYPLAYAAERVAGDDAEVQLLTSPGTEPHDLELSIRETATLAAADLVVLEEGFQPAVDDGVAQSADGLVLDAVDVVDLIAVEESEEEHADHEGEEHDHEHGDVDPHFWLDPLRMADLGDAIAADLGEVDPDHADGYAGRAADLRRDLVALDAAYAEGLADCEVRTVVVSHDAFGYLEQYGLTFAGVAGLSPDAEPSPAGLAELQQLATSEGVTTVFSERLASPRLTDALAGDLGLATAVLDPVEGLTEETADQDYVALMEQNLEALRDANRCR